MTYHKTRTISSIPLVRQFKPIGIGKTKKETIYLFMDEYESIRLIDYLEMKHEEAAEIMQCSRIAATRSHLNAIKKVSRALIEGKTLSIRGGLFKFSEDWHKCRKCNAVFINRDNKCSVCGNDNILSYQKLYSETENAHLKKNAKKSNKI